MQAGFGRNGFGVDYGRYNVTQAVDDLYRFRTPPLYNVTKTAPYSHSGSVYSLEDAIRSHVDPLAVFPQLPSDPAQRSRFYEFLRQWAKEPIFGIHLDDAEIRQLASFLGTLEYESEFQVSEQD